MTIAPAVLTRLKEAVGPSGYTDNPEEIAPHLVEWRGKYHGRTALLLRPSTTVQVSRLLAICNETGTSVVPQGGNTQ